ncbi:hypothetical protein [Cupriavidus necator]
MKRALGYLAAIAAVVALSACGGGNDNSNGEGSTPPATSGAVVTTAVGDAIVTKTFQPGVLQLPTDAATSPADSTLAINSRSAGSMKAGTVVFWNDRAYVVTAATPISDETIQVTTRPAEFQEVFADIEVTGNIKTEDLDLSRMTATMATSVTKTPKAAGSILLMPQASTFDSGPCTATVGDGKLGESSSATCDLKVASFSPFDLTIKSGFRDSLISGVDIKFLQGKFTYEEMQITPFMRAEAALVGSDNKPVNIAKEDIPIFYLQVPVKSTGGFLRLDIPLRLDVSLPVAQFRAGIEVAFPYSSKKGWTMQASIDTPAATFSTDQLFQYEAAGHLYGVVGVELVLAKSMVLAPNFEWFKPNSPDRMFSLGALFKGGVDGTFSFTVDDLHAKPCFKWDLRGAGGVASDVQLGTDRDTAQSQTLMKQFGDAVSGSSGCEETGFWRGTAEITACTRTDTVCNFLTYNINRQEVAGLAFRTGGEQLNFRLDQEFGCIGATASIQAKPVAGATWTYSLSSGPPFANQTGSTAKWTVTTVTDTIMEGTVSIDFSSTNFTGTATGKWRAQKQTASFPKCLLPSPTAPKASNTPAFFCPGVPDASTDYGCTRRNVGFTAPDGEWLPSSP